ncbi:charged multivesicular body protein 6-A, partial [Reticulomyxa filosa]
MGFLFGRSNATSSKDSKRRTDELTEKEKAELEVKRQRDRLIKYQKKVKKKKKEPGTLHFTIKAAKEEKKEKTMGCLYNEISAKWSIRSCCEEVVARETEICKQLLKEGKKDKAKLVLRKKKYQQQLLDKAQQQLLNIEQLINNIEFAQMQNEVFKAMREGTDLLQQINSEMSIEEVERLMDETQEAIEHQKVGLF